MNKPQLQLPTVKMVATRLSGGIFLQHIWQVQNHSIYKIICKVVGGKLQNGKDVFITNDSSSLMQALFVREFLDWLIQQNSIEKFTFMAREEKGMTIRPHTA